MAPTEIERFNENGVRLGANMRRTEQAQAVSQPGGVTMNAGRGRGRCREESCERHLTDPQSPVWRDDGKAN